MNEFAERIMPWIEAVVYSCVPLFPLFITLTNVNFPGVSLLPIPIAVAILALMVILSLVAAFVILFSGKRGLPLMPQLFTWLGATLLAAIVGFNPHDGLLFIGILFLQFAWYCTITGYYSAPGVARAIYWSYMLSGLVACALAIATVVTRQPASLYTIGHGRAIGTFILPGELAGYLIVFIPIAYAVSRIARSRKLRIVAAVALALAAIAMVLTFSRAGWIGLAGALAFFSAMRARTKRAGVAVAIGIVGSALVAVLLVFNAHHDPSENYTRISIWQTAAAVIDRFPLTGVGPFGFSHLYALVRLPDGDATAFHAHSVYLTFLAELGIVGVSAVAWAFWAFAVELRRRLALATHEGAFLAVAVTAGLVGTLVQGLIDTVSVVIFGLWFPTLALALVSAKSGMEDA